MKTAQKVRVFIQSPGHGGGAFEVARVAGGQRQIARTLRPLSESFNVSYYTIRQPRTRLAGAGGGR